MRTVSSLVPECGITSPMFASQIPLAKWRAQKWCGRPVSLANCDGSSVEEFVVKMVPFGACSCREA